MCLHRSDKQVVVVFFDSLKNRRQERVLSWLFKTGVFDSGITKAILGSDHIANGQITQDRLEEKVFRRLFQQRRLQVLIGNFFIGLDHFDYACLVERFLEDL